MFCGADLCSGRLHASVDCATVCISPQTPAPLPLRQRAKHQSTASTRGCLTSFEWCTGGHASARWLRVRTQATSKSPPSPKSSPNPWAEPFSPGSACATAQTPTPCHGHIKAQQRPRQATPSFADPFPNDALRAAAMIASAMTARLSAGRPVAARPAVRCHSAVYFGLLASCRVVADPETAVPWCRRLPSWHRRMTSATARGMHEPPAPCRRGDRAQERLPRRLA